MAEAMQGYAAAIEAAERDGERAILAEALRRLGVVYHQRDERGRARELCERSYRTASELGDAVLAAEALNALAGFDFESGAIAAAREKFYRALELGAPMPSCEGGPSRTSAFSPTFKASLAEALTHYQRSVQAFESIGDDRGCAGAYQNLGMVSADRKLWDDADRYFRRSLEIAETIGDVHLKGLGLLNHAEVHLARQRYESPSRTPRPPWVSSISSVPSSTKPMLTR